MLIEVQDKLDRTELGFVRAMARELLVARWANHDLEDEELFGAIQLAVDLNDQIKAIPTNAGLKNGKRYSLD